MLRRRPRPAHSAIALIERRGRLLICRRRPGGFLGGYWEFPGGKRRPGERWAACLRRELREELGVTVKAVRPLMTLRHLQGPSPVICKVYRCAIARGRPRPLAATTLRWVPVRRLARYRFPPANRPLLARLRS
ncbi:MAG: (deoxy)nucleoside triphosphate pyrophosphohydrolase [Candidatus Omnitrophica bacterium]|nr:(deoxy)nucleoside triphosphate pyrophosphohydrolase [Candidatus Omnitrophota bacterium]